MLSAARRCLLVGARQNTSKMPGAQRASSFSFNSDGQHLAAQRDFAVMAMSRAGNFSQRAGHGRGMVMPARARLGNRAFGHVQMHVHVAIELAGQSQSLRAASDVAQRGLRRLLHHVPMAVMVSLPCVQPCTSVVRMLAAYSVQASPVTRPTSLFHATSESRNLANARTLADVGAVSSSFAFAEVHQRRATCGNVANLRSRLRTPASRVYLRIISTSRHLEYQVFSLTQSARAASSPDIAVHLQLFLLRVSLSEETSMPVLQSRGTVCITFRGHKQTCEGRSPRPDSGLKGGVLLRVQHFEQCRGRVAAESKPSWQSSSRKLGSSFRLASCAG